MSGVTYQVSATKELFQDLVSLSKSAAGKAVRILGKLATNPFAADLQWEKLKRMDPELYSTRVDDSYRVIWRLIKPNHVVIALVDKHDVAYARAARMHIKVEDGIVVFTDLVKTGGKAPSAPLLNRRQRGRLFAGYSDEALLSWGVPRGALSAVRRLDDVNELPELEHAIPINAYDRLLSEALGIVERPTPPDHVLRKSLEDYKGGRDIHAFLDSDEFKRALEGSMADWMLFLQPELKRLASSELSGPYRLKGIAGSGKTALAVHRARFLARESLPAGGKVLFLTYGNRLPTVNSQLLRHLAGENAAELRRVECRTLHSLCGSLLNQAKIQLEVDPARCQEALDGALAAARRNRSNHALLSRSLTFFEQEIKYAIKGRAVTSLDGYLKLERSGRGTPLNEGERRVMFEVYQAYQSHLDDQGICDFDDLILRALCVVKAGRPAQPAYRAAVVDEVQDMTQASLILVRELIPRGPNDLFLVGDGLQRVYPGGYCLSKLGIDIVGRSKVLTRNYRNTAEVLATAHALVEGCPFDDGDDAPASAIASLPSSRHGEAPLLKRLSSPRAEITWVGEKVEELCKTRNIDPRDCVVLYRQRKPYEEEITKLLGEKFQARPIDQDSDNVFGAGLKHTTFHSAKGLEFKAVFVVGVSEGVVPSLNGQTTPEERQETLERERRLLYVAMTRARDLLFLTHSGKEESKLLSRVPPSLLRRE